jgi:Domain of unknown function (DUF4399)
MRKANSIAALLLAATFACNDSGSKVEETAAVKSSTSDTAHSGHVVDAATDNTALPAIPDGAKVFFANLKDGQTVKSPFKVEMGVEGIGLDTAGTIRQASGHHHILVNLDSLTAGTVIPMDSTHLHFGKAQQSAEVKLAPGKYKLTLQYADGIHRSYGARLSTSVNVTVQ